MTDLPGYYMPHCVNCYATSHSIHNCPYNNDEEGSDDTCTDCGEHYTENPYENSEVSCSCDD